MRLLKPGGRALIYVWAFEQEYNKQKSKYLKEQNKESAENNGPNNSSTSEEPQGTHGKSSINSSLESVGSPRPVDNAQDARVTDSKLSVHTNRTAFATQDLLVPWHLKDGKKQGEKESGDAGKKDKRKANSKKMSGKECCPDPGPALESDMSPGAGPDTIEGTDTKLSDDTSQTSASTPKSASDQSPMPVFHRYYHVFQQGELEQLCAQVAGVRVQSSYHDQGNWCVVLEKD